MFSPIVVYSVEGEGPIQGPHTRSEGVPVKYTVEAGCFGLRICSIGDTC